MWTQVKQYVNSQRRDIFRYSYLAFSVLVSNFADAGLITATEMGSFNEKCLQLLCAYVSITCASLCLVSGRKRLAVSGRRHCVLRRQCWDTNQNIKKFGVLSNRKLSLTFRALVLRQKERATRATVDFTFHIGSTPSFLYFDLCRGGCFYKCFVLYWNMWHNLNIETILH